ncbi:hypothetical protein ACLMJK_007818 [Lecanora helva]
MSDAREENGSSTVSGLPKRRAVMDGDRFELRDKPLVPPKTHLQRQESNSQRVNGSSVTSMLKARASQLGIGLPHTAFSGSSRQPFMVDPPGLRHGVTQRYTPITYNVLYKDLKGQFLQSRPVSEKTFDELKESARGEVLERKKIVRIIDESASAPSHVSKQKVLNTEVESMDYRVDVVEAEQIIIYSPLLIKAVKQAVKYWPSHDFIKSDKILVLNRPYRSIGAHRNNLDNLLHTYEALEETDYSTDTTHDLSFSDCKLAAEQIRMLTRELDKAQKDIMEESRKRHMDKEPVTSFDALWMLYTPGTIAYHNEDGEETPYVVRICQWSELQPGDPLTMVNVEVWNLDFNGTHIDRRRKKITLLRFEGEMKIRDLVLYPERYAKNHESKRADRKARGEKYFRYLAGAVPCLYYEGHLSQSVSKPQDTESQRWYEGRVIVDPRLYGQEQGVTIKSREWVSQSEARFTGGSSYEEFIKVDPKKPKFTVTDDFYFLLPQYIRGFTLDTRQTRDWVETDANLVKNLAIDESKLKRIKALTARRPIGKGGGGKERITFAADSIEGKGAGRIIILHGPPGMGKTYTAECIAEWAGIDPTKLEKNLQKCFVRAEKWDAILLIDEADVFVEQREPQQPLEKDTITAVFLRALEFYRGIIFLTTNRMFEFDDAIQSRASLIVKFDKLNSEQRMHIRQSRIDRLKQTGRYRWLTGADEEHRTIDNDTQYDWTGRDIIQGTQINFLSHLSLIILVLQSAVALAEFEAGEESKQNFDENSMVDVDLRHIREAITPIRDFAKYRSDRTKEVEAVAKLRGSR